jgi:hypothetical protein
MSVSAPTPAEILDRLAHLEDDDQFALIACLFPALLRKRVRDGLAIEYSRGAKSDLIHDTLRRIEKLESEIANHKRPYASAAGPIERLWAPVRRGELPLNAAIAATSTGSIVSSLAPVYVSHLADFAIAIAHQNEWREAMQLMQLVRAAVGTSTDPDERPRNLNIVESSWVEISIRSLIFVPDRRLLLDAEQCGLRVVERTGRTDHLHGLTLHRLGILHFDPYVKGRDYSNWPVEEKVWHAAFRTEHGASASALSEQDWHMPPIAEALAKAESYLRSAVEVRHDRGLGYSLKALSEVIIFREGIRGTRNYEEATEVAKRALTLLDPRQDAHHIATLSALLESMGQVTTVHVDSAPATEVDPSFLEGQERVSYLLSTARVVTVQSAPGALASLREARDLFARYALPQQRARRLELMQELLVRVYAPREKPEGWAGDWDSQVNSLQARIDARSLSTTAAASIVLEIALGSGESNREEQALHLLKYGQDLCPTLAREYEEVFGYVFMVLLFGSGANLFNSKELERSAVAYGGALQWALKLSLIEHAAEILKRVSGMIDASEDGLGQAGIIFLIGSWLEYERELGETGALDLGYVARSLHEKLWTNRDLSSGTWAITQLAKGFRFGQHLNHPAPSQERSVDELALLDRIAEIERDHPQEQGVLDPMEDELLLVSFARTRDHASGAGADARLRNLQHRFDVERSERSRVFQVPKWLDADAVQAAISDETVLVTYFLGRTRENNLALCWLAFTGREIIKGRITQDVPAQPLFVSRGEHEWVVPALGTMVMHSRQHIRAEPGYSSVCDEAEIALREATGTLIGNLSEVLEETKQRGKTHLCIVPHGALHFFPFHLIGPSNQPLAQDWLITYLPHLNLLMRPKTPTASGALSVGQAFEHPNPRGLPELRAARREAVEVANLLSIAPLIDAAATPVRVLELLPDSRYAHFATHGAHNVLAPSFHCMYLAPAPNGHDRLFAHNIEMLDLRGVELVTLSACETALGRFDVGDNLRGLPSSFFRAGVRTLVGTLWKTKSDTCQLFISTLYRELLGGRKKGEAFKIAQAITRQDYPEYRDWGAFYLMGEWK